jgi:ribosome-associated toxin RatA of RatAB toxin-antitoxin module
VNRTRTLTGLIAVLIAVTGVHVGSAEERVGLELPDVSTIRGAYPAPQGPTATVVRGPEGLSVEGRFIVTVPPAVVWAVLTDYDGIDRFVSSMRESRVAARDDGHVTVEQVAVGRLFLFSRRLRTTLSVREEPPGIIRFEDVLHKDFEHYRGEWRIDERGREVVVTYRVDARPIVPIPDLVVRGVFQRTARQLLVELQQEMEHRAAIAGRLTTERSQP